MDLSPLGLAIHVRSAVPFVFGVGEIIDHLAQSVGIGRRGIGLQIDLGGIEPVEAVLENILQRIGIAGCEATQLTVIQHPHDLITESVALRLGLEGRGQLPCPLMGEDAIQLRRFYNPERWLRTAGFLNPGIGVAQTFCQLLGHIPVARLQVPRDGH